MSLSIGMDFGTSNSEVAEFRQGRPKVIVGPTPSVVGLKRTGEVVYGLEAKENFCDGRDVRSIKRLLGTQAQVKLGKREMSVPELAVTLMAKIKQSAEEKLTQPIDDIVITVPSNSKGPQRLATKCCATALGLHCLTLINEPTAAAIAYGIRSADAQYVLVYDLGGGTFDVTLLRVFSDLFEEVASKGISRLGGDDFDRRLMTYVAKQVQKQKGVDILADPLTKAKLWLHCEQVKIELDRAKEVQSSGHSSQFFAGSHFESLRNANLDIEPISRELLENLTKDLIHETREPVEQVLRDAGLQPRNIDHVLLVGGQSRMPAVQDFVANLLDRPAYRLGEIDPLTCVAEGAAIVAAILHHEPVADEYEYVLTLEHSLCTGILDQPSMQERLDPILERGTRIPEEKSKTFCPILDYQPAVSIQVYEGDVLDDPGDENNVLLGTLPIPLDPPRPAHECPIKITYHYGEDGILGVRVEDITRERAFEVFLQNGQMNAPDAARLRRTVEELLGPDCFTDPLPAGKGASPAEAGTTAPRVRNPDAMHALSQAEEVLRCLPGEDRPGMKRAMAKLEEALGSGDPERVDAALARLQDLLTTFSYLLA